MEINLNPPVETAAKVVSGPVRPKEAAARTDDVVLDQSQALEARLAEAPEVRTEAVERGKALATDPRYPPAETIRKIANLLAINFDSPQ
jgi:hypothetical protein